MAHIVEVTNPFNRKDTRTTVHPGGITIRVFLGELYGPLFEDFAKPTVCTVNGTPLLRDQWSKYRIKPKDVVQFITFPGYVVPIVYWIIALVTIASVVVALSQSVPNASLQGATPEPDPVYDLKGQRNQIRLGNPIEVPYGRCRLWPSYAARPYNKFIDNDQYQYQLFCLGQGTFDIEKIQIEDTLIANFQDVEYEIYQPGDEVTLFPDNVQTSTEVGGIELFGPNETEFTGPSGPYAANDAGTQTTKLEVDVSLPAGLYLADKASGVLSTQYLAVDFQYREIDNDGNPVGGGDWLTLQFFEREIATNTPQRYTLEKEVPAGRYEVQATRANNKNKDTKAGNVARWDALRSFMPSTKNYGAVTLIAMKARATNNLNDRASNRFNVVATRKLRTRVSGVWTAPVATRSICWAFADNFQALYGGRLADAYLDLDELEALDAIYTSAGWNFDWVFDQRSTVWDQAKIIARCGRAVPMLVGSQVTMIRDYPKTVPTAFFNQENIVQGSFKWEVKLANIDEFDGLQVEYTDPNTFLPEFVECLVDGEAGDNLEQIKFPGCTDRQHAYTEGLYMRASKLKLVENITFQTGLEGGIPSYGDLIQVVHDLPRWGQGGLVRSIAVDNITITLNEPVTFGIGVHKIGFRKKDGSTAGPFTVTAGSVATEVVLSAPIDPTDYFFDNLHELPLFMFGPENLNGILCTVVGLTPSDNDEVEVKAVVYDASIFTDGTAPALDPPKVPDSPPDIPVMNCSSVRASFDPIDETQLRVSWAPAYGAKSYNVQRSADGVTWVLAATTSGTHADIATVPGEVLFIRVQPVGKGAGAYCAMGGAGPGGGEPLPPPPASEYKDLWPLEVLMTGSLAMSCKTRGGTVTLRGYSEYTSPSLPPKKYLRKAASGSGHTDYYGTPDCTGGVIAFVDCDTAWVGTINPDTGVETIVGGVHCEGTAGPVDLPGGGDMAADCGAGVNETQTSQTAFLTGTCCPYGVGGSSKGTSVSRVINLSNEDTEQAALQRLLDTLPAWEDIAWASCTGLETVWETRGAGDFDYEKIDGKILLEGTGFYSNWDYTFTLTTERKLVADSVWSPGETLTFTISAGPTGVFSEEIDVPNTEGYQTRIAAGGAVFSP